MRAYPASLTIPFRHRPVQTTIRIPGGKSPTNRALLLAAVARGDSRIDGLLDSDDTDACFGALAALGVACRREGDTATVSGCGGAFPVENGVIPIGSAGTVGRFLPGFLAAAPRGRWTLSASAQLSARPLAPLVDGLRQWGAAIDFAAPPASFPLGVSGGGLRGGPARVSAKQSSQFASGLLLAAPLARQDATVVVSDAASDEAYFNLTLALMRDFGVIAAEVAAPESVPGLRAFQTRPGAYRGRNYSVPADANTANYFFALAAVTGGCVTVANLKPDDATPGIGFLDILRRLGCHADTDPNTGGVRVTGPKPLSGPSKTTIAPPLAGRLRGGFTVDLRTLAESAPTLAVLACFADAPVEMRNLAHIRGHETDRLAALATLLPLFGAGVEEFPDGLRVTPPPLAGWRSATIDPRDDHRLAMAMAVAGTGGVGVTIENPGCVAKTCPDFFELLRQTLVAK